MSSGLCADITVWETSISETKILKLENVELFNNVFPCLKVASSNWHYIYIVRNRYKLRDFYKCFKLVVFRLNTAHLFKAVVIKHFIYSNSFFRDLNWADQTTAEHAT